METADAIKTSIANAIALAYAKLNIEKSAGGKYFLVFACLKSQGRTDKFIQQMKEKGIDVTVLLPESFFSELKTEVMDFQKSDLPI